MHIYDVIIVGAGPVGLATAIGLRQRGINNILVLEQTRAFRQVGQTVDLLPNGLKALRCLDGEAYEEVKKAEEVLNRLNNSSQSLSKWFIRDLQGQIIRSIALNYDEWLKKYGEGRLTISWFNLQTTLRNLIPQEQVKANHRCINVVYESEKECVRVDTLSDMTIGKNPYAYWNSEEQNTQNNPQNIDTNVEKSAHKCFWGRLIVAADGINSTVRKVIYQNTSYQTFDRPEYSGYAAIICSGINNVSKQTQTELQEKFLQNSRIVTITDNPKFTDSIFEQSPRIILFTRQVGHFGYLIHIPVALNKLQEKSLISITLQKLEKNNFPNTIKELVRISNTENMQHRNYYIHRAIVSDSSLFPTTAKLYRKNNSVTIQPAWHSGRVVLVGDAAHGIPPFAAQGANQGLEDALTIATLISRIVISDKLNDINAIQEAFKKYEYLRRTLIDYVQKVTMKSLNYYSNEEELEKCNQKIFARNFEQLL